MRSAYLLQSGITLKGMADFFMDETGCWNNQFGHLLSRGCAKPRSAIGIHQLFYRWPKSLLGLLYNFMDVPLDCGSSGAGERFQL